MSDGSEEEIEVTEGWVSELEGQSLSLPNPGRRCRYCMKEVSEDLGHEIDCPERPRVEKMYRSLIDGRRTS